MSNTPLSKKEAASFLKRLKKLRTDLGIKSVAELARFIGCSERTLGSWFNGEAIPTIESCNSINENLQKRYDVLRVQVAVLNSYFAPPVVAG